MIRAPLPAEVPYPFLDIAANGVGSVAISSFSVLGLFLLVSAIVLAVDHVDRHSASVAIELNDFPNG